MQCPRCQADNREGRRFCAECGASLALPCAACGFSNEPGEKFCGGCGMPMTPVPRTSEPRLSSLQSYTPKHLAEQVLASRAALEGERKQVTVLFADMKSSLELLADRDPEEARKLLDPVLERMMEAVHRYEGTVNQVMGDGIMALFGAPLAHEDHAVLACYTALAMQAAMRRLDPLSPESAEDLLQALLGDDAGVEPLTQRLIERTEGNPFFLEESVRTLVEIGVLDGESGAYRLAKPLQSIQVPATVQAVLAARIDRLPAEEKRLLQTAAVIGTEVPLPLMQAIAEMSNDELRRGLAHLQAAEFLYETNLFPELAYTFKHALTHEVAYGSLLQERRRALHARIVDALEALYPNRLAEQVERLAHHALRGEIWDKALTYFREAGTKAGSRSAYREAVGCFEQALEALMHLPESRDTLEQAIDLRVGLRNALYPLGEIRRINDLLHDAATLAEALDDRRRLGRVFRLMCSSSWQMGDYGAALEFGQRALAIDLALGDVRQQFSTNVQLAFTYHALGEYRRAIAFYRTNLVSLEGVLPPSHPPLGPTGDHSVNSRTRLSQCLAELGAFAEGITIGEEGIRLAEAFDNPMNRASAYSNVGDLYLRKGDLHKAIAVLERGVELCQVCQIQLYFPPVASPLGLAYALSGRVAEGLPLLEQAVERAVSTGFMPYVSRGLAALSEAYLLAGRPDEAMPLAQRALEHARQYNERGNEAWALRLLGEIWAHRDPPEGQQAEDHYRQALALAEELVMRPLQAHCYLGLGTLYTKIGRREEARGELSAAIELYRAMEMTFWLPQAEAALAQVV